MNTPIIPGLTLDRSALDRARKARDARFDGRFFVAGIATGIYCRPICPTPNPKPKNVRYFATAAAASEAGFRPCLRCRPEAAPESPAWLGASAVVRRALELIDNGALDEGTVEELASRLGITARHLRGLFVGHVGASPLAVAQTRRLQFAKKLIDETDLPMTEVALESGYRSLRRFNAVIRESYRRSPSELRRRHRQQQGSGDAKVDGILLRLPYRPPYDWQWMLEYFRARAVPELERVDGGAYARNIVQDGRPARIVVRAPQKLDAIELEFQGTPGGTLFSLVTRARRVFDLAVDPQRIASALRRDRELAPLLARHPGLRIPGAWDGFECAVRAVLSADSPARERRLVSRLVRSCGSRLPSPGNPASTLTHLFPTAQALAVANLEGIGLAGSQAAALRALADAFMKRELDFDAPPHELVRALVALPGVDESTAQHVALHALGDPDAFPARRTDLRGIAGPGVRHVAASLARRSQSWRPWRGYAALHLSRNDAESAIRGERASGAAR